MDHIAAKRQRQAIVLFSPPDAEVFAQDKAFFLISQLALVNDQADLRSTRTHRTEYLVKRIDDVIEFFRWFTQPQLQREKGAGHCAGNRDFFLRNLLSGEFFP